MHCHRRCRSALSRQSLHARGVDVAANLFGVTDVKVLLGIAEEDVLGIPVRVRVRVKGASEGEGEGEVEGEGEGEGKGEGEGEGACEGPGLPRPRRTAWGR